MTDLDEAITFGRQTLDLCPSGHPERSTSLNNVASYISGSDRYQCLGEMTDLNEATILGRQALDLCPSGDSDRSASLVNVAKYLSNRYNRLGDMMDLNEAIILGRQALDLCPSGHPLRSSHNASRIRNITSTTRSASGHFAIATQSSANFQGPRFVAGNRCNFPLVFAISVQEKRSNCWSKVAVYFGTSLLDSVPFLKTSLRRARKERPLQTSLLDCHQKYTTQSIRQAQIPVIIVNASQDTCDTLVVFFDRDPVHILSLQITKSRVQDLSSELQSLTFQWTWGENSLAL